MGSLRGNSTFLKSYHSMRNVELNIPRYSLVARSAVLRPRFAEHRTWESAAPPLKNPDRLPDSSTLRRWCHRLDSSPAFSFLRRTLEIVEQWLDRGEQLVHGSLRLAWPTVFPFLGVFWLWPLRLCARHFFPLPHHPGTSEMRLRSLLICWALTNQLLIDLACMIVGCLSLSNFRL